MVLVNLEKALKGLISIELALREEGREGSKDEKKRGGSDEKEIKGSIAKDSIIKGSIGVYFI